MVESGGPKLVAKLTRHQADLGPSSDIRRLIGGRDLRTNCTMLWHFRRKSFRANEEIWKLWRKSLRTQEEKRRNLLTTNRKSECWSTEF